MEENDRRAVAAMWALGDYAAMARHLEPAADEIARTVGDGHGRRVLDLATGTGTLARALARRGWAVSATDLCVPLLETGRREADTHGLVIDWRAAPLDESPYADAVFSVVTSSFGLIFAGDPPRALAEARRCLKPGGLLAFTAWAPRGHIAEMTGIVAEFMPAAAHGAATPMMWGESGTVAAWLAAGYVDITTTTHSVSWRFENSDAAVDFYFTHSPAHIASTRAAGEHAGAMREAVRSHLLTQATPTGQVELSSEYTLTSARRG